MNYIPDKELYKAVMFAKKMMREGTPPGKAISISGNYYGYSASEINSAMHSGEKKKRKSEPFYWWVVETDKSTWEDGEHHYVVYVKIKKATLSSCVAYHYNSILGGSGYSDEYQTHWITLNENGFETKKEAEEWAQSEECKEAISKYVRHYDLIRFV